MSWGEPPCHQGGGDGTGGMDEGCMPFPPLLSFNFANNVLTQVSFSLNILSEVGGEDIIPFCSSVDIHACLDRK